MLLRIAIAVAGCIALLQYGRRVGVWWSRYSRVEKVNRVGWGVILCGLIEGAIEGS